MAELISEKEQSDVEAEHVRERLQEAVEESRFNRSEAEALQAQFEWLAMQSEVDRLRTVEQLRLEHQKELSEEQARTDLERKRYDSWIASLEDKVQLEKLRLEERVHGLEEVLQAWKLSKDGCVGEDSVVGSHVSGEGEVDEVSVGVADEAVSGRVVTVDGAEPSARNGTGAVVCEKGNASGDTSGVSDRGTVAVDESVASLAGGWVVSEQPAVEESAASSAGGWVACEQPVRSSVAPVGASGSGSTGGKDPVLESVEKVLQDREHPALVELMAKLLKAQTKMLAAQAQAAVAQGFPPLPRFSGEKLQSEDDSFERWIESFKERATLAGWSKDQRLYQLKVHLKRTALQVFRMLPEQEQKEYDAAVKKLKERFWPVDIAELKGIEFHSECSCLRTIISRQVLHEFGKRLHSQGKPLPKLEKPSARLYGKDGQRGSRSLDITTQATLNLVADGKSVSVPVFVQPHSEQSCLLGTNATFSLGLKFLRADGRPLHVHSSRLNPNPDAAMVCLVQSSTLPGRKGRFLEGRVDALVERGDEFLFEPNTLALKELGLGCQESLLKVGSSGQVLVPLQNFRRDDVVLDEGTN